MEGLDSPSVAFDQQAKRSMRGKSLKSALSLCLPKSQVSPSLSLDAKEEKLRTHPYPITYILD